MTPILLIEHEESAEYRPTAERDEHRAQSVVEGQRVRRRPTGHEGNHDFSGEGTGWKEVEKRFETAAVAAL